MKFSLLVSSLCITTVVLAGCASTVTPPEEYSGFLKDYSRLKEDKTPSGATVMRWIDPKIKASNYTSIYVEPSQLYPAPKPTAQIPLSTLQGITHYYDQALQRELGKSLPLASGPGPGVLVVRPAITAVSSKNEGFQPYEVLPIALVASAVNTAAGGRDQTTTIATEVAVLDGGTNQVVAQVVRKGTGENLENSKTVMTAADAKAVLDGWADDIHKSFDKVKSGG
ncbi:hypothetical protein PMM47T1_22782 [Pseudomonas sp. M47T1]|uniref:DUF3313 domain-containing protein n=1 Tax=unclassified Pseudomonas TaxID=196821 RepID=UPI0002606CB1|nr:DUF3313 domain-containing protein [Pseudomonas sp. M47T1]EIK94263.1 hypothetical protein PMM47T1_22782 [Pseudomonas sp. M47T1]